MATVIHLDTHVAAWLYAGRADLLSRRAAELIEEGPLRVSPMATLELQYLFEIERVSRPALVVIEALKREFGLRVCDLPFEQVVSASLEHDFTRDPFDRLIVSQAELGRAQLLTKDRAMREAYSRAVW